MNKNIILLSIAFLSTNVLAYSAGGGDEGAYTGTVTIGVNSKSTGANAVTIGNDARGSDTSVSIGASSNSAAGASAVGPKSIATGINSTAIGLGAQSTATGENGIALGVGSVSSGSNALALGVNANASGKNSVAIGHNSTNDRDNSVSFGSKGDEKTLTNVSAGIEDTDAVNVSQLKTVSNSVDKLQDATSQSIKESKNYTDQSIRNLKSEQDKKMNRGLATSAALSGLFQPYGVGKFNVTASFGGYKSETAVAIGSGYRFNEKFAVKAGVGTNTSGNANTMYNVSGNFEW